MGTIFDTDVSGMSRQHGPIILVCCTDSPGCCWLTNLTSLETFFFFVDNIETCQLLSSFSLVSFHNKILFKVCHFLVFNDS